MIINCHAHSSTFGTNWFYCEQKNLPFYGILQNARKKNKYIYTGIEIVEWEPDITRGNLLSSCRVQSHRLLFSSLYTFFLEHLAQLELRQCLIRLFVNLYRINAYWHRQRIPTAILELISPQQIIWNEQIQECCSNTTRHSSSYSIESVRMETSHYVRFVHVVVSLLPFVFVSHTAQCYFGILYHSDKNSHLTPVRRHTQMLFKQARTRFCHSALWFWKNRFHIELKLLQSFIFYSKCWFIFAVKMFWGKWKWNSWYFPEK